MRNPNGPSDEEKEAMQDRLLDMNEEWERKKGKWACNGCQRPIQPSDIEYSRETCDCGGDLIESNLLAINQELNALPWEPPLRKEIRELRDRETKPEEKR